MFRNGCCNVETNQCILCCYRLRWEGFNVLTCSVITFNCINVNEKILRQETNCQTRITVPESTLIVSLRGWFFFFPSCDPITCFVYTTAAGTPYTVIFKS